jgi:hypothetical protein
MTDELLAAAARLANMIATENAALAAFDLSTAAANLAGKESAAAAFAASLRAHTAPVEPHRRRDAEMVGRRLASLVQENRRLLERSIAAQRHVIEIIARASRRELVSGATRYGAFGAPIAAMQARPIAISSRA